MSDLTELVTLGLQYVRVSMFILIPILMGLGLIIKNTNIVKDEYIPLILIPLGILGAVGLDGVSVESILQGILVALGSVGLNQVPKQLKKLNEKDDIDKILEKE